MNGSDDPMADLLAAITEDAAAETTLTLPRERTEPPPTGPPVAAAPGDPHRLDLSATLHRRRSARFYAPRALPLSGVTDTIARGIAHDTATWPEEQQSSALQVDAVAFDIDGLEPAIYRVEPADRTWLPLQAIPAGAEREYLTLQPEFSHSAVVISIAADLDSACARHGAHGYRLLMGRVSAAAYTMWLDGVAQGWVGSVFAGFIPASVRLPLHSDGTSRYHCFALALGHPPAGAEPYAPAPPQ